MRMPGIGTEMIRSLGAVPTLMAPGDLFPALQAGTLDATDFTGPANDMALGFQQVCKFLYWPCIQKPGAIQQVIISKAKFDKLPKDLQEVVTVACEAAHQDMLAEYNWINAQAVTALKEQHDVKFLTLPRGDLVKPSATPRARYCSRSGTNSIRWARRSGTRTSRRGPTSWRFQISGIAGSTMRAR